MKKIVAVSLILGAAAALILPDDAEARRGRHGGGFFAPRIYVGSLYRVPYYGAFGYWGDYRHGFRGHHARQGGGLGRIDFEVRPKNAQVFVDGHYVGEAKKLDGFPDHLWLRQGSYEVTIYAPGFQTVTQELAVFPKRTTEVTLTMAPGASDPPPAPPSGAAGEGPSRPASSGAETSEGQRLASTHP